MVEFVRVAVALGGFPSYRVGRPRADGKIERIFSYILVGPDRDVDHKRLFRI